MILLVDEGGARAAEMAVWLCARGRPAHYSWADSPHGAVHWSANDLAIPFDEVLARRGPPAVFTLDHKGRLGMDEARTRSRGRGSSPSASWSCVTACLRHATGWHQYVSHRCGTERADHPRARVHRFPSAEAPFDALASMGGVAIVRLEVQQRSVRIDHALVGQQSDEAERLDGRAHGLGEVSPWRDRPDRSRQRAARAVGVWRLDSRVRPCPMAAVGSQRTS